MGVCEERKVVIAFAVDSNCDLKVILAGGIKGEVMLRKRDMKM